MTGPSGFAVGPSLAALVLACSAQSTAGDATTAPGATISTALELELVQEKKIEKVLSHALDHYAASGVTVARGQLYVAFDDSTAIAAIDTSLETGTLLPGESVPSQYEAITTNDASGFYVMVETVSKDDPRGQVVALDATTAIIGAAWTDTSFTDYNQGFEGVAWLRAGTTEYLLALCENADCTGDDAPGGRGRLHLLALEDGTWVTRLVLEVPGEVAFANYSDLALFDMGDGTYRVAVLSRKSSALWLGKLTTDPWALLGPGTFYGFPQVDGAVGYCALEGVTFLGPRSLALVSDTSNGGKQCNSEDESIHLFEIPQ